MCFPLTLLIIGKGHPAVFFIVGISSVDEIELQLGGVELLVRELQLFP